MIVMHFFMTKYSTELKIKVISKYLNHVNSLLGLEKGIFEEMSNSLLRKNLYIFHYKKRPTYGFTNASRFRHLYK